MAQQASYREHWIALSTHLEPLARVMSVPMPLSLTAAVVLLLLCKQPPKYSCPMTDFHPPRSDVSGSERRSAAPTKAYAAPARMLHASSIPKKCSSECWCCGQYLSHTGSKVTCNTLRLCMGGGGASTKEDYMNRDNLKLGKSKPDYGDAETLYTTHWISNTDGRRGGTFVHHPLKN